MDQERFIEQFETTFLATWAANEYSKAGSMPSKDYEWLKAAPLKEARLLARHMWYRWMEQFGPPVPWR